ncbi:MAG: hypothetical protein VYE00_06095 [Candidatus Poribacteria bacterium]|jgi:uncharacterized protein YoxC|nr:hypothetical protein [Candidatus Neomarinimicrobiota bacterium]MEC7867198.1 hypothetical protein [Candidatus Poribacteria bacterium]
MSFLELLIICGFIVLVIGLFRITKKLYWKIDRVVELLESIDNKMGMETDPPEEQIMTV